MQSKTFVVFLILLAPLACGRGSVGVEPPIAVPPDGGTGLGGFEADLDVTIEHPDTGTIQYRIICEGETASVDGEAEVDAGEACGQLSNPLVQNRLIDGPPTGMACTEIYGGPDVATIEGSLVGVTVAATIDRVNGCGIGDWDDLLQHVLPPALGFTG